MDRAVNKHKNPCSHGADTLVWADVPKAIQVSKINIVCDTCCGDQIYNKGK